MKNVIYVLLVICLPLTLASETQRRFTVNVFVSGNNAQINNTLESHLKRELRLLGDVDIVEKHENWEFVLAVRYGEIQTVDGRKTGFVALASVFYERIPESYFRPSALKILQKTPVYPDSPFVAHVRIDKLDKYCVAAVGDIDKRTLMPIRGIQKVIKDFLDNSEVLDNFLDNLEED